VPKINSLCIKSCLQEFDTNKDGSLEAHEVGEALRSRNVKISDEQVAMFIDGENKNYLKLLVIITFSYLRTISNIVFLLNLCSRGSYPHPSSASV
jgi:hypothetical protein